MWLLRTISALLSAENKEAFSFANLTSLSLLSTKDVELEFAPKTAVFMIDHHFCGVGAFIKSVLLCSLNAKPKLTQENVTNIFSRKIYLIDHKRQTHQK